MLLLSIFGLIVGVILGTRFRVLILVPVIFLAATTIIAASVAKGFGVGMTLVALLTLLASVEFGYLIVDDWLGANEFLSQLQREFNSLLVAGEGVLFWSNSFLGHCGGLR